MEWYNDSLIGLFVLILSRNCAFIAAGLFDTVAVGKGTYETLSAFN
jgi:hypothetical protein